VSDATTALEVQPFSITPSGYSEALDVGRWTVRSRLRTCGKRPNMLRVCPVCRTTKRLLS